MKKVFVFIFLFFVYIPFGNKEYDFINTNNLILNTTRFNIINSNISKYFLIENIEGISLIINEIPKHLYYMENGSIVNGFVIQHNECDYYLFLSPMLEGNNILMVLSHELIHIKQYYTKKLIYLDSNNICWEDSIINLNSLKYLDRPWEQEAFNNQHVVFFEIKN
jgi:hypothetical protein